MVSAFVRHVAGTQIDWRTMMWADATIIHLVELVFSWVTNVMFGDAYLLFHYTWCVSITNPP